MKKIITLVLTGALAASSLSCTTTYDAYGNPRQSVDPGTAAAGAAAAGILGYALAKDRDRDRDRHRYHYRRGHYDRFGRYHRH